MGKSTEIALLLQVMTTIANVMLVMEREREWK